MIGVEVFGAEVLAERFKQELRAFKREQRKQMRLAANVVKRDVIAKVESTFPTTSTKHKRRGATPLGPLRRKIGVRVIDTKTDVIALIRPKASAFYGRFQETGLNVDRVSVKARRARVFAKAHRLAVNHPGPSHFPFRLPRKPFLEPVAAADTEKVTAIIGDSYGVFYRGGA